MAFSGVPPAVLSSVWVAAHQPEPTTFARRRRSQQCWEALVEIIFLLNGETYLGPRLSGACCLLPKGTVVGAHRRHVAALVADAACGGTHAIFGAFVFGLAMCHAQRAGRGPGMPCNEGTSIGLVILNIGKNKKIMSESDQSFTVPVTPLLAMVVKPARQLVF
ncbi:cation/H(+) antiporter 15-like [Panicum miliaceum]|uniref:Cation/H(+) antiporter 15-like n=1 Tax=Panicum miliaceum TaxID=4540 RepID=A0A3L6PC90_PANMI|nr:cation/H(+) antiporter 15-like [Panicum miliaceum]